MIWHAMPPEVNTSRLMLGAGAAPMLQAAAGWEAFAIALETQADELAGSLVALAGAWSGQASEKAIAGITPMVLWLRTVSLQAHKRSVQAMAQATAYTTAMATTPPLVEIEQNHVTRAVLHATNFLGVNTVPIGVNEADYFVRMWNQAAGAMDVYQAETAMNILFEPIVPMKPIVIPGAAHAGVAGALGKAAASAPATVARNVTITAVGTIAKLESARLAAGRAGGMGHLAAERTEGVVRRAEDLAPHQPAQLPQQGMQMGAQMAGQLASTLGQLPQQASQLVSQPMQQLTQPLQQVSSVFGQMGGMGGAGGSERSAQIGLVGASPFSNHPLAGGSGPSTGSGLVRAASLPGAGGTPPMTSLIANLIGQGGAGTASPATGAVANTTGAGAAPIGGGMGAPMGAMGQSGRSGGSKTGLKAPAPLIQDLDEDEGDDW